MSHLSEIGRRIRSHREAHKISQEQLAERAKLHRTYIGGVERGERNLSATNLIKISEALDIDAAALVTGLTIRERRS